MQEEFFLLLRSLKRERTWVVASIEILIFVVICFWSLRFICGTLERDSFPVPRVEFWGALIAFLGRGWISELGHVLFKTCSTTYVLNTIFAASSTNRERSNNILFPGNQWRSVSCKDDSWLLLRQQVSRKRNSNCLKWLKILKQGFAGRSQIPLDLTRLKVQTPPFVGKVPLRISLLFVMRCSIPSWDKGSGHSVQPPRTREARALKCCWSCNAMW